MQVYCLNTLAELVRYAEDWDRLSSGVPFRSWTWLSTWWRHYGPARPADRAPQLAVPCVFDDRERLVGLGPWYLGRSAAGGRVLRMLGSGEVCSDYLSILAQPGMETIVADALVEFLMARPAAQGGDAPQWDLLELDGVDAEDRGVASLAEHFAQQGAIVHRRPGLNCWRLMLPTTWDGYYELFSKNRAKQLRRLERIYLESGRAVLRMVEHADELPAAMDLFISMHQRRRQSLGEPGSFASPRFTAFFREVLPPLFRSGHVQFYGLEVDGRPAASEYLLTGDGALYAYQAAIEPDARKHEPGKLINLAMMRRAVAQGYRAFDFLRGDEPYKANLRAQPRPSTRWRIVPNRAAARWRHSLWLAGRSLKHLFRRNPATAQALALRDAQPPSAAEPAASK